MDDLSRFCCLNSDCPEHGKRGAGNLTVTSHYGPDKRRRMLRCRACKARFSERKGTPLFDSRLPPGAAESVLEHIAEGCGVRRRGGSAGWPPTPSPATAASPARTCQGRPRRARGDFPPGRPRCSSMRSGPSSPRRRRTATAPTPPTITRGDYWDHVALDAEHRLVISVVPGPGRSRTPRRWWPTPAAGPAGGPLNPHDQRRLPGLRDGDPARLWGRRSPRPPPAGRVAPGAPLGSAGGPELRRGHQATGEGAGSWRSARGWSSGRWRR